MDTKRISINPSTTLNTIRRTKRTPQPCMQWVPKDKVKDNQSITDQPSPSTSHTQQTERSSNLDSDQPTTKSQEDQPKEIPSKNRQADEATCDQKKVHKVSSQHKPISSSTMAFKLRALELQVLLFGPASLLGPPLRLPKVKKKKNRKLRSKNP